MPHIISRSEAVGIKEKVHALKKELLLQEASRMFEEIGYEEMKLSDLAKKAGVSMGTIYSYFHSKEGLYLTYIEHQIDAFVAELEAKTAHTDDAREKIRIFTELKFSYYMQKRKAVEKSASNNPLFFNTLAHEHAKGFEKIYRFLQRCFMQLNARIDRQKAQRLAYAFNGFGDGYIGLWLEEGGDLMRYSDEVCELFISMMKGCCR